MMPPSHPARPTGKFLIAHPAHLIALGFGSGLSPKAPGTAGTLWGWLVFLVLQRWMTDWGWAALILLGTLIGWWAAMRTAHDMQVSDPGSIVIDEILAFWLVLWILTPAWTLTGWLEQLAAFALFRYFDAAKPGPVGWADRLYHDLDPGKTRWGWAQAAWGILLDDFVAAFCTLLVMAVVRHLYVW
jgi:phosphatidylglycerophosphatase A